MTDNAAFSPEQEEALKSILGERTSSEYTTVELPSNGLSYQKTAKIRPFTFSDEKFALKADVKKSDFLNVLLKRCVKDIDLDDLYLCDKLFLVYKLKEISTGSSMPVLIECEACGLESSMKIDLSVLNVKFMKEDLDYPIKINLDVLQKEAKIRPARVREESYSTSFEVLSNNLWRFVESIHEVEDKTVLAEVIPRLPVEDVHNIMRHISLSDYGIDPTAVFACPSCSNKQEMEVPLTTNFFGAT